MVNYDVSLDWDEEAANAIMKQVGIQHHFQ